MDQFVFGDFARAEGRHADRSRFGNADGIRHLNFAAFRETRSDNILGNVARRISCRAIHFGWILARESAAAVTGHAAVGIDDDFAAGETAIAHRTADDKASRGVDEKARVLADPFRRQHRADDFIHHGFFEHGVVDVRTMLR